MPSSSPQDAVNAEWNAMAGEWDDLAKGYRDSFEKLLLQDTKLLERNTDDDVLTILDFGCGTGLLTESLRIKLAKQYGGTNKKIQFLCLDAASSMIHVLQDKIKAGEWSDTVSAYSGILSQSNDPIHEILKPYYGKIDLIVASSVLSFIPESDLSSTLEILGKLLKSNGNGMLYHSDWPKDEKHHPDGFTTIKCEQLHSMANLMTQSIRIESISMGGGGNDDQMTEIMIGLAKTK